MLRCYGVIMRYSLKDAETDLRNQNPNEKPTKEQIEKYYDFVTRGED